MYAVLFAVDTLKASQKITDMAGSNISAVQRTGLPSVVCRRKATGYANPLNLSSEVSAIATIRVNSWAAVYEGAVTLSEEVKKVLFYIRVQKL